MHGLGNLSETGLSSVVQGTTYLCWVICLFLPPTCVLLKSRRLGVERMCDSTCWQKGIDFTEVEINRRKIKGQGDKTWIYFFFLA